MVGFSREVAKRIFAEELRNSNLSFRDGEDQHQYAPMYLLTPTGAKCNRVFIVGTLTERDDIGGDTEYWRGRIVDPTGSILVYAGQYQPEAAQKLASIEPPAYVAVVGKQRGLQTRARRRIRQVARVLADAAAAPFYLAAHASQVLDVAPDDEDMRSGIRELQRGSAADTG